MINVESIIRSDIVCSLVFVLLFGLLYAETRFKKRTDKWVALAIVLGILSTVVSIGAWTLEGVSLQSPLEQGFGTWLQFSSFMITPFIILSFLIYTWLQTNEGSSLWRGWVSIPFFLVLLVVGYLAYETATGSTVVYDAQGFATVNTIDIAAYVLDFVLMSYALAFTVSRGQELGRHETLVMSAIYVVGISGMILETAGPYCHDVGYVGMMLCMVLAVIFVPIQRSIRAKESEAAKSMFVASVSHDIRTPLNAILGFTAVLQDKSSAEADREQALEAISASGNLLMGLVNDVLDFSKIEKGMMPIVPAPTDVGALGEEVMTVFRGLTAGSPVRLRYACGIGRRLLIDSHRVRQILFNLLGNAVKFTSRGEIALDADYRPGADGLGTLTMRVADTGVGIPADKQSRLMQPYVQLQRRGPNGGTGLGLYISRRLAEAMGGSLALVSEYGKGSTFTLTIQGVREAAEEAVAEGSRSVSGSGVELPDRILLVDDMELNLKVMVALLGRLGCTDVVCARNGAEALDVLRKDPTLRCVLTDLMMPEMDGTARLAAIRADPALKGRMVYAVTGEADPGPSGERFDGVLVKPVTAASLRAVFAGKA